MQDLIHIIKTRWLRGSNIALAVVLLLLVNLIAGLLFKGWRLDLTDQGLYTLSEGSRQVIEQIDEPIHIDLFYSEGLGSRVPAVNQFAQRVKELLATYNELADGKLVVRMINPEPFSEAEDEAVQAGLQGAPIDNAGNTLYFGLQARNAVDEQETIPFFNLEKEASLEYDLTRIIAKLNQAKRPVVGVLSSLPLAGDQAAPMLRMMGGNSTPPWVIYSQMEQNFELRSVADDSKKIDDDIKVLMLVHPKGLSDATLFAIDQFVLRGGRLLAFVDPYSEADTPATDPSNPLSSALAPRNSDLKKLFDAWGVSLSKTLAGDMKHATRVSTNSGGRPQAVDYVLWLNLRDQAINRDDFVTAELDNVTLATAGSLHYHKDKQHTASWTPLLSTSAEAMDIEASRIQFGPNPAALLRDYKPGSEALVLAARLSGKLSTAFPDGPPEDSETKAEDALKTSKEDANLILFADTDLLSDASWVRVQNFLGQRIAMPRSGNGSLVMNALDNLSGSNALISLRSRGNFSRPFDRVQAMQREAEQRLHERETALQNHLDELEAKLNALQQQKGTGTQSLMLNAEQSRELERFRAEQLTTRKQLRAVRHDLQKDIASLGSWLKLINIALVPVLLSLFAVRLFRRRARQQAQVYSA